MFRQHGAGVGRRIVASCATWPSRFSPTDAPLAEIAEKAIEKGRKACKTLESVDVPTR
jgi:hypothetical protein